MSITVTSTTDAPEAVLAVQGGEKAPLSAANSTEGKVEDVKPASAEKPDEKLEASEASEDDTETDDEESGEEKPDKPKRGFRRRIAKLNAKLSAAEERTAFLERELQRKQEAQPEEKRVESKSFDGKPKADDFETHDDYVEAIADWKLDKKFSERDQKAKEQALKAEFQKTFTTHQERVQKFVEKHEDWEDVIHGVDDIQISQAVHDTILESEFGPEVMYELAKDPEEYERICKLSASRAAIEIGKLEAKFQKTQPSEKKPETKITKAPKPIAPVGSQASSGTTVSPDEMSYQDYKKWREAQLRG